MLFVEYMYRFYIMYRTSLESTGQCMYSHSLYNHIHPRLPYGIPATP